MMITIFYMIVGIVIITPVQEGNYPLGGDSPGLGTAEEDYVNDNKGLVTTVVTTMS